MNQAQNPVVHHDTLVCHHLYEINWIISDKCSLNQLKVFREISINLEEQNNFKSVTSVHEEFYVMFSRAV